MDLEREAATPPEMPPAALQAYLLGQVDFEAILQLQRRLHYEVSGDRSQAALILCEHPPLITVGRQGSRANILLEPHELCTRGWPVRWVNRAGGCWLHSPGQLAIYSILPLDSHRLTVTAYVRKLGEVVLGLLGDFDIRGEMGPGGVWTRGRLIAGLGVAVRDWVGYYGLCVNVFPELDAYRLVRCAPDSGEPMTSLERERHGRVRPSFVRERLVERFRDIFGFERVSLFSDHPALKGLQQRCHEPRVAARR